MTKIRLLTLATAAIPLLFVSCASTTSNKIASGPKASGTVYKVKTTAYSHLEKDSLRYGNNSATGQDLRFGKVRSAAADWSVFPVGTLFQIKGEPYVYQVDDYGRALVGTKTIDLYRPTLGGIDAWGARNVNIKILRWGSYRKSLDILKDRTSYSHVRSMVNNIKKKPGIGG